ncbi:MAG TPA: hypothetical protein VJ999_13180 [Candidatus Sulfotelmatobacter sp.]|nr:hypothetical protein [Candidatus Sulfotelmatobacter sp.]
MDRSTEWPWSWEEEAKWKAELEERDYDFLDRLMDSAVEGSGGRSYVLGPPQEEPAEDSPEKYSVTA